MPRNRLAEQLGCLVGTFLALMVCWVGVMAMLPPQVPEVSKYQFTAIPTPCREVEDLLREAYPHPTRVALMWWCLVGDDQP